MSTENELLRALSELESALDEFRTAYAEWLDGNGGDGDALKRALASAESRLESARAILANAGNGNDTSHP